MHNCMNLVFKELPLPVPEQSQNNDSIDLTLDHGLFTEKKSVAVDDKIVEKVNFTVNKTHKMYFARNSSNVSLAILALKTFDLIFTNMQFIDNIPMSSNRDYLLKEHSLATLT